MATSRDDFSIAVRSAFLKKGTKQKFSLFALIVLSILLIFIETFNFKTINYLRYAIKDTIYRGSIIINFPNKIYNYASNFFDDHYQVYYENQALKLEIQKLNKKMISEEFLVSENRKLKKIIETENLEKFDTIIAKVILDKDSPFLQSVVLNKGSNADIIKGMPVLDGQNLAGRIVEVNFFSSRALLLGDLNSRVPVIITPNHYHSIMVGRSDRYPVLEYLPDTVSLQSGEIVYTSGKDGVLHSGIPVGIVFLEDDIYKVKLFSDANQLDFVNIIKESH